MLFVALAIGVAVGAADDESEWRAKDARKSVPARSLADDWEDDAQVKRSKKAVKPSLRQITTAADDDFEKPAPKPERPQGAKPAMVSKPKPKATSIKPGSEVRLDEIVKTEAVVEPDEDALPLLGGGKPLTKTEPVQPPPEASESQKQISKLPELPRGLSMNQPPKAEPKVLEVGPNEATSKTKSEPAPKIQTSGDLPTLPKVGSAAPKQDAPPAPKPMGTAVPPSTVPPSVKTPPPPTAKPVAPPPSQQPLITTPMLPPPQIQPAPVPPGLQAVPTTGPVPTTKVDLQPAPQVVAETAPTAASPPVLMEHGAVDESANICMPLMDAASAWRFESRTFLMWWDQPGTAAFVRDAATDAGLISGVDYNFEKQFAQQLSLERRFDAATALVITGLMTEDARRSVGAIAFGGLDLGIDGPGSGILRNLSGFTGRATSRLWKVDVDFVQHYLQEPDAAIRGRYFLGPQFIGLNETYRYGAEGAIGEAHFDARTINTLFGASAGLGVTFQPWYSNLGIDVSGRYGVFGNVFDVRSAFFGPGLNGFVGAGDDDSSRFATAAELNVEASLRIARNVCLIAGWRLWNIQGIGRAVSQAPTSVASPTLVTVSNGNLFAHGLFVGATVGWGGAADPHSRYGGARPYILREP
jgi:hypothetical protein